MTRCALVLMLLVSACASPPQRPYDEQFATLATIDERGQVRAHAWRIAPKRVRPRNLFGMPRY